MVPALALSADELLWIGVAKRVWQAAVGQNNVIVVVSRSHNAWPLSHWCETLGHRYGGMEVYEPGGVHEPAFAEVARYLCEDLPEGPSMPRCIEELGRCQQATRLMILADQLGGEHQRSLASLIAGWADHRRRVWDASALAGPQFILVMNDTSAVPPEDIGLSIVRTLDYAVPCDYTQVWDDLLASEPRPARRLWQSAVLPELAAYDASFPDAHAWTSVENLSGLTAGLQTVAHQRGWTSLSAPVEAALRRFPPPGTCPNVSAGAMGAAHDYSRLWEFGLLGKVAGRGWDLHAAALVGYRSPQDLCYRAWRGQVRVVRPLVDIVRRRCELFVRSAMGKVRFEAALAPLICQDGVGNDDPATTIPELDDLASIAQNNGLAGELPCQQMRVCHRAVRNRLAHGRIVDIDALEALTELIEITTELDISGGSTVL